MKRCLYNVIRFKTIFVYHIQRDDCALSAPPHGSRRTAVRIRAVPQTKGAYFLSEICFSFVSFNVVLVWGV